MKENNQCHNESYNWNAVPYVVNPWGELELFILNYAAFTIVTIIGPGSIF